MLDIAFHHFALFVQNGAMSALKLAGAVALLLGLIGFLAGRLPGLRG